MIDKDALLREAEELRRSAESVKHLDEAVESRSNAGKRKNLVEAIKKVQANYLYTSQAKVARAAGTINNELVKSVNGQLLPDLSSIANFRDHYEGTPNWDTAVERHLLASECFTRIDLLKKGILEGKFDHLLENHAERLVHGVMGYNGELLEALGIDPKQGETYRRITEIRQESLIAGPQGTTPEQVTHYGVQMGAIIGVVIKNFVENRFLTPPTPTPPITAAAEGNVVIRRKVVKLKTRTAAKPSTSDVAMGIPTHSGIGIIGYTLSDRIASDMGYEKETRGMLVIGVFENSIAEKAGLRAGTTPAEFGGTYGMLGGDIIIGVEDKTINKLEDFMEYISHYHTPGTRIRLRVIRNRELVEVTLVY